VKQFKDFTKKYSLKLGALVLVVALLSGFTARNAQNGIGPFENGSVALALPVSQASTGIVGWLEGIYGYMFRYDALKAENEALKMELAKAKADQRKLAAVEQENSNLRSLLQLREKHSDFTLEAAYVVDRPSSNWSRSFTLTKGSESGIKVGNCVIDSAYDLVGQVSEVGDGWCTVRSVIDADMRAGALVGEGGSAAMIVGEFALMQKGQVKLSYLADKTKLVEGETIITSGKGGAFPRGLTIGSVTSVSTEAGGQTEYACVTPAADLDGISQVFVIKSFNIVE
jgi:rod shape-determining protein MreC